MLMFMTLNDEAATLITVFDLRVRLPEEVGLDECKQK